jgi:hypothetical protein
VHRNIEYYVPAKLICTFDSLYKSNLQNFIDRKHPKKLVECLCPHVGGEEGDDGGEVGDEAKEPETGEEHALAPELELLPNLTENFRYLHISYFPFHPNMAL